MSDKYYHARVNTWQMMNKFRICYDHYWNDFTNYPHWGGIANPYSNLTTDNYAFGRFSESYNDLMHPSDMSLWVMVVVGYVKRTRLSDMSVDYLYLNSSFWYDAADYNSSTFTYENVDWCTRYTGAPKIGDIRLLTVGALTVPAVVEKVVNSNNYYVSLYRSSAFHYINIVNGAGGGYNDSGKGINNFIYPTSDTIIQGHDLGWKLPIWMYKKIIDKRR